VSTHLTVGEERPVVVVAEDDDGHALLTQRRLTKLGYATRRAATGAACIDALAEGSDCFVLLDLGLPDAHEFEILDRVIESHPLAPVVVVTGNDDLSVAVDALRRGAWDYVVKRPDLGHLSELSHVIERNLERRSLMRDRSLFRSMISHDIRNPLNIIYNYADMLEETMPPADAGRELLERIKDNALTTLDLVSNFVELDRIEAGQLCLESAPMCFSQVVRRVVRRHQPMAENKQIALELQEPQNLPSVFGDRAYLERVVSNLISNAIKFTPDEGRVDVKLGEVATGIAVSVQDTGCGIGPNEVGSIFRKYRRTASSSTVDGSGLGLFIVQSIVEAHGGTVSVDSAIGHGATFTVTLPHATPRLDAASSH